MQQRGSAISNLARWIQRLDFRRRWAAARQFIADFWFPLVCAIVLGLLLICIAQSREIWRHYILSSPENPNHALFVVAAFLFAGVVFAKSAYRRMLQRDARGGNTVWVLPVAALLPLILTLVGVWYAAYEFRGAGVVGARMTSALALSTALIALLAVAAAAGANSGGAALARLCAGRTFNRIVALAALALLVTFVALPLQPLFADSLPAFIEFVGAAQTIGALPAFLFSLALLMYVIDAALAATGMRRFVALAAVIVSGAALLLGDMKEAHGVRLLTTPKSVVPYVGDEFLRWLETREDKDRYDPYPVFIVGAQGGGLFAAYHTARVLANLQDQCPSFAQHVFAISGVSGGSLGAGVFASAVKSLSPKQSQEPCREKRREGKFLKYTDDFLKRDFLSSLAFLSIIPNIVQRILVLLPGQVTIPSYDRALGLEYGFERAWYKAKPDAADRPSFFAEGSAKAWSGGDAVPALILNATRADTGVTYAIAPFRLDADIYHLDFRARVLAVEAPEKDVRVSTAIGLSARYPIITPPGMIKVAARRWLEKQDKDRTDMVGLVDGGFVENSGLATVEKLLLEIHNAVSRQKGIATRFVIHVISVNDLSAVTHAHSGVEDSGQRIPEKWSDLVERKDLEEDPWLGFVEFTAPLTALNASRRARSFYTLNSLNETIATLRCAQGREGCRPQPGAGSGPLVEMFPAFYGLFGLTANNRPLPLAWQLSSLSWERIAKRSWADESQSWTCSKRQAAMMDEDNIAELRGLGEDLGGFVDRWIYACGREYVRDQLKWTKPPA